MTENAPNPLIPMITLPPITTTWAAVLMTDAEDEKYMSDMQDMSDYDYEDDE
jgi:hypothetical protein